MDGAGSEELSGMVKEIWKHLIANQIKVTSEYIPIFEQTGSPPIT